MSVTKGHPEKPRLAVSRRKTFFQTYIQCSDPNQLEFLLKPEEESSNETDELIASNVQAIHKYFNSKDDQQRKDFVDFLLNNCCLIVVNTANEEQAFRIFSTLNGRGSPLSEIDKLKAHILNRITPENNNNDNNNNASINKKQAAQKWESFKDYFGSTLFNELFKYICWVHATHCVLTCLGLLWCSCQEVISILQPCRSK